MSPSVDKIGNNMRTIPDVPASCSLSTSSFDAHYATTVTVIEALGKDGSLRYSAVRVWGVLAGAHVVIEPLASVNSVPDPPNSLGPHHPPAACPSMNQSILLVKSA